MALRARKKQRKLPPLERPEPPPNQLDAEGWPLSPDCFVKVRQPRAPLGLRGVYKHRGLVDRIEADRKGAYLVLREWRDGKFTGQERLARPRDAVVVRGPKVLREKQVKQAKRNNEAREASRG